MYREKVGIIGGFGAYATLNFYKRLLEEFASESERNYPHIIMDNNLPCQAGQGHYCMVRHMMRWWMVFLIPYS